MFELFSYIRLHWDIANFGQQGNQALLRRSSSMFLGWRTRGISKHSLSTRTPLMYQCEHMSCGKRNLSMTISAKRGSKRTRIRRRRARGRTKQARETWVFVTRREVLLSQAMCHTSRGTISTEQLPCLERKQPLLKMVSNLTTCCCLYVLNNLPNIILIHVHVGQMTTTTTTTTTPLLPRNHRHKRSHAAARGTNKISLHNSVPLDLPVIALNTSSGRTTKLQ